MSYQWDVFISYRREDPVERWVQRILRPAIQAWLPHYGGISNPRVFLDADTSALAPGGPWPQQLRDALAATRVLVPVLSPDYFASEWCMIELTTMLDRATATGASVVYAVQFSDGNFYPTKYRSIGYRSLERFNRLTRSSALPGAFTTEIQGLCRDLGDRCRTAPAYDPTWTVTPAHTVATRSVALPRFGDG